MKIKNFIVLSPRGSNPPFPGQIQRIVKARFGFSRSRDYTVELISSKPRPDGSRAIRLGRLVCSLTINGARFSQYSPAVGTLLRSDVSPSYHPNASFHGAWTLGTANEGPMNDVSEICVVLSLPVLQRSSPAGNPLDRWNLTRRLRRDREKDNALDRNF